MARKGNRVMVNVAMEAAQLLDLVDDPAPRSAVLSTVIGTVPVLTALYEERHKLRTRLGGQKVGIVVRTETLEMLDETIQGSGVRTSVAASAAVLLAYRMGLLRVLPGMERRAEELAERLRRAIMADETPGSERAMECLA